MIVMKDISGGFACSHTLSKNRRPGYYMPKVDDGVEVVSNERYSKLLSLQVDLEGAVASEEEVEKIAPSRLQYNVGYKMGRKLRFPIANGLTIIFGEAGAGKTSLMSNILQNDDFSSALISWGEPEPESVHEVSEMLYLLDFAVNQYDVVLIDSLKRLAHMGGAAMAGGVSRELLDWLTVMASTAAAHGWRVVATFNPQLEAEKAENLYTAIKASVTTIVRLRGFSGNKLNFTVSSRAMDRKEIADTIEVTADQQQADVEEAIGYSSSSFAVGRGDGIGYTRDHEDMARINEKKG
jgi:archaellum biogenesis ATPase FlaH